MMGFRRVGGLHLAHWDRLPHAVIDIGEIIVPHDLAASYHRVGGKPAHPT